MASETAAKTEQEEVIIPKENRKLDTKQDVEYILQAIEECEQLTTLQLSGNSYGVEALEAIGSSLEQRPLLSRALWSDMFVSRLKSEIPPAITALGDGVIVADAHLTELDLSDNAFGPAIEAITTLLTSPVCFSLKVLKLNNNGLGIKGGNILAKALLECHEEAQKVGQKLALEVFVSGRNRLENVGATALSEVFETLGTLVHVAMIQNGINKEGISCLAGAFSKNPNLEIINLNDNTFTEEGATAMAQTLPSLQKLRVIDFGDCLVRPEGGVAIATAIKDGHKLLEEVHLGFDELDQDCVLAIADSLANKDSIKCIDLNGNCIGNEGIVLLKESLEAKGLLEALGSLSEDECIESDEEEEDREEETEDGVGDVSTEGENVGEQATQISLQQSSEDQAKTEPEIGIEDYFNDPCGENLVALGDSRAQIIMRSMAESSSSTVLSSCDVAAMYARVTGCYTDGCSNAVKDAVETTIDVLVEPLCQDGRVIELLNEILVQVGLIKSEDKKFQPVKDVEGPLLALKHIARQQYFPRGAADILIAFMTKPSPILESLASKGTTHQVLQVLHTL